MKKLVYIILISFAASMSLTACTEEEILPDNNVVGTSGKPSDPM